MDTIVWWIESICMAWTVFSLIGYAVYKLGIVDADNWEDGIKKMLTGITEFVVEEMTGRPADRKVINTGLMLRNDEALELVKCFEGHPYETPTLTSYIPNQNGCAWYDISALQLVGRYRDLSNEDIAKMSYNILQNYFMQSRGVQVMIYIFVSTPTRLYFAVVLSGDGAAFLETMRKNSIVDAPPDNALEGLEEEIPLFDEGLEI